MAWMRLAGDLLISWIPLAIGFALSKSMQNDLARQKELIDALHELESAFRLSKRPPAELLIRLGSANRFFFIDASDALENVIENACFRICGGIRDERIVSAVRSLFTAMQSADVQGVYDSIEQTENQISVWVKEKEELCKNRSPLSRKLGALVSIFVFIILL